ncbi:hypothetical protein B0J13DRAFT_633257 [Dactylonectria estremocensis]|uniref:Uncharacterized protein n=1 Tax=Dactylonectria estremocensis TaxID=1079267 RepID=A0A9P9FHE5_9HYPO|nr:hypothetical protein B0J13DRAFT_633257 [Dactylonectria estremocensis]
MSPTHCIRTSTSPSQSTVPLLLLSPSRVHSKLPLAPSHFGVDGGVKEVKRKRKEVGAFPWGELHGSQDRQAKPGPRTSYGWIAQCNKPLPTLMRDLTLPGCKDERTSRLYFPNRLNRTEIRNAAAGSCPNCASSTRSTTIHFSSAALEAATAKKWAKRWSAKTVSSDCRLDHCTWTPGDNRPRDRVSSTMHGSCRHTDAGAHALHVQSLGADPNAIASMTWENSGETWEVTNVAPHVNESAWLSLPPVGIVKNCFFSPRTALYHGRRDPLLRSAWHLVSSSLFEQ